MLIVFFDDRFWSDARVSYQIECCRIEVKSFLVLGGVSNPIVVSARFLITSLREVPDNMRHFAVYMLTFDVILISTQRL